VKTAQTEAFRELVDEIRKDAFLKDQLVSLIVFGSFIRGDFIEKQSDLDIYGVFNKMSKETISKLTELIEKHVKIKYRVLDFARS
jgi:predicted nucleotidyltransferase